MRSLAVVIGFFLTLSTGCHETGSSEMSSGILALTKACSTQADCATTATCDSVSGRCRLMAAGECRADDPNTCACETTIDCPRFFECRRQNWRPLTSCTPAGLTPG